MPRRPALVLAIAIAALAGCRQESSVILPDGNTGVTLVAINGSGRVTLGWTGSSAATLYRSANPNFVPSAATRIASVPAGAAAYTDSGLTNGSVWYYRLIPSVPWGTADPTPAVQARPYDYDSVGTISFAEHIRPIFQSGCAVSGCHASAPGGPLPAGGLSLAAWEEIFRGSDHGAVVVPYRADKSHLVFHLNADTTLAPVSVPHMPLPGLSIPASQLSILMRWIDEGAENDFGAVAFSTFPEGRVMATNQAEDVVSVIDIRTRLVARYVRAGLPRVVPGLQPQAPHNLYVDTANGCYYVVLVAAGKIEKYRLSDNAIVGELTGVLLPTQVALSASGDTGFVAQFSDQAHAIRMFDPATMQLLPQTLTHPQLSKPHGVELTPDGRQLYITGNLSDNVIVYDIATQALTAIWLDPANPVVGTNFQPYQTVMTHDGKFVYVSCQRTNEVRVIDRDSAKVVRAVPVGSFPLIMAITPDDRFVYVANRNSGDVSVIRTADNTVAATIPNVGPQPHGVAIDRAGRYAYVACENSGLNGPPPHHPTAGSSAPGFVVVIDIAANRVVQTIEVANFAAGIEVVE